jgi:hypothetical protein
MLEEQENRKVNRRRLLRRAGTVVAGVAGAGVVTAVVADPAQAANGANVLIGNSNGDPGDNTTSLSHTNASTPTLSLVNGNTDGPALALSPVDTLNDNGTPNNSPTSNGPVGSLIADDYGDFWGIGDPDNSGKYLNLLYSPTWAAMTIPTDPFRWLDTRNGKTIVGGVPGRTFVSSGSFDGVGRVIAHNNNNADLVLEFGDILIPPAVLNPSGPPIAAVQLNVLAVNGSSPGFISVWGAGAWPGTSSVNYAASQGIANFVQVPVDPDTSQVRFKVSTNCAIVVDVCGYVLSDALTQFQGVGKGVKMGVVPTNRRRAGSKRS